MAWVLAAEDDIEAARREVCAWSVGLAVDLGTTLIDHLGNALGGWTQASQNRRPTRPARLRRIGFPSQQIGAGLFPAKVSRECCLRLAHLNRERQLLIPPRPHQSITIGVPSSDASHQELWAAWRQTTGAISTVIVTDHEPRRLETLGFTVVAERPSDSRGLPALRSWLRPPDTDGRQP
jgi:hypothetical protein